MVQNLVGATTSKDHPRKAMYAKSIGGALRHRHQPDVNAVVKYLMTRPNKRMSRGDAENAALSKSMSKYVRTTCRTTSLTITDLESIVSFHALQDKIGEAKGELPLLQPDLPAGKRGPRGANSVLQCVISCLKKRCGEDPYDVDGM